MAKISGNSIQLGDSATATNNFVLQTALDGTAKLSRGNVGATTQDVLTVGANGVVVLPNNIAPKFIVDLAVDQSLTSGVTTVVVWGTELYDTNNNFSSNRFTPTVAGFYQINLALRVIATNLTQANTRVFKNGATIIAGMTISGVTISTATNATAAGIVYMNGTTDYIEATVAVTGTSPKVEFNVSGANSFSASFLGA
jgi:hypothetical protein